MNDLERDLREVLHEDARRVRTPASPPGGLRRSARRRQVVFAGVVGLSALAIVAGVVAGASLLLPAERSVPGVEPVTSGTLNGITITYPRSWVLIDPDAEGLNGPGPGTEMPRIVLALAPSDPGNSFGCPGLADGVTPSFLMTVQEMPHARAGKGSAAWPVSLEPFGVDGSESACYPGWEFLAAVWTAEGRSFDARIGLSPDATEEDREALFGAFESMTFEPSTDTGAVILATGTAGGEEWQLIATRQVDGLVLSLEAESTGTGTGDYDPSSDALRLTTFVAGDDERAIRIVFGAVPAAAAGVRYEVSGEGPDPGPPPEIFDVPDQIDPSLNAFLFTIGEGQIAMVEALDSSGTVIATGETESVDAPVETPSEAGLGDGRHFGFIRSVDVAERTIEFDLAYWLSGDEADAAYQAAGGTRPVPNDYYVVNENSRLRTLPLSSELGLRLLDWNRCCDTFFDGDLALFAQAIEIQRHVTDDNGRRYAGLSQWWITVQGGVVTAIEEQYAP